MSTRKIICSSLAFALALAAPLAAQDKSKTEQEKAAQEKTEQYKTQSKAESDAARRDAERALRDAERQMHDAERAMQEAARKMAEVNTEMARAMVNKRVVVFGDNARLGVVLRPERDPKTDAVGAMVQALTPGGPAEEAGLQPGDIIVKFNGEALAVTGANADEPGPTDRLMERASTLKEGDTVTLEVKRGAATKTYTVTARRIWGPKVKVFNLPDEYTHGFDFDFDVPEPPEPPEPPEAPETVVAPGGTWFSFSTGIRGLEMMALNPDLGEYFGTKEGLLVVKVDEVSPYKLKAGDVILKIGDRTPTSPSQAVRILRSYGPGETVPIEVMRNHQRTTLTPQMPERRSGEYYKMTAPAGFAAPAVAPAPAAAAAPAVPPPPPVPPKHSSGTRV